MERGTLREVTSVFLRIGLLSFGGAVAQVAMMRRELVQRRNWLSERDFLDLFGIMNLVPGPTGTETAIALGYWRAGWPALVLGGAIFILPAMICILALGWAYVRFGELPAVKWVLYGVSPVVIAIIAEALWGLGRVAIKKVWHAIACVAALVLYFRGVSIEIILLATVALAAGVAYSRHRKAQASAIVPLLGMAAAPAVVPAAGAVPFGLARMFLTFLKIGAISYGSGYVLLAFLHADFVTRLHWLTEKQLLDSIAAGQVTPGPVFASATFIGYLTGGFWGAILATLGIFLPSFFFVAAIFPLVPRLKSSAAARTFLNGINASTMGLMAAVTWQLGRGAIIDAFTAVEGILALLILLRFRINAAWLIVAGVAAGCVVKFAMR